MKNGTDIAIIGSGPNGLSIAAHLAARRIEHRIFGKPMGNWIDRMPRGMELKSEGFASSLYNPGGHFSLGRYCAEHGIPYEDIGLPPRIEHFSDYGCVFQRRFVPDLEVKNVVALETAPRGFDLRSDDGEAFTARRVVVATGISHFEYLPEALSALPAELVTHSSAHPDPAAMTGRDVTVIGSGASGVDLATLLHEAGARVQVISRKPRIDIHDKTEVPRPLSERLRAPFSGIGPSWRSYVYSEAPPLFHMMPEEWRVRTVGHYLGPAAGYFMKARFASVPRLCGYQVRQAEVSGGRVLMTLMGTDGSIRQETTDHVIAATGYRVDLTRLPFLGGALRSRIETAGGMPKLSMGFQSAVPGLYFVGPAAANSFGPVMRFAFGAKFTAPWVGRLLSCRAMRHA